MTRRPRSPIGRFFALLRGGFAGWVRRREQRSPSAVYEDAIQERTRHYADLKRAVAGILYMRNKLDGEIGELRAELARTHEEIRAAVRTGRDGQAISLIEHKHAVAEDLARAEQEIEKVRSEADEAKGNLVRFRDEIRGLEREKVRIQATLANAHARRRIQEALEGFSLDGEMRALESVREYVARVRTEGHLDEELGDEGLAARIRRIRKDSSEDAARQELEELKRSLRPQVLPADASAIPLPESRTAAGVEA
jgi:phage shock protein A